MKNSSKRAKDSHDLAYLLRHDKTYTFETGGWRSVENLVHKKGFSFNQLCDFVVNDSKGRFEFNEDKTKIRALYGHSVLIDMNYACCTPPEILYHGSSMNANADIAEVGLKPRSRNDVHLTSNQEAALETGARHGAPIAIQVKALEMFHEGYKFYNPARNIWLVREVPSRFIDSYYVPMNSFNLESINHKMIKVVCDTRSIIEALSRNSTIASLCEIVPIADMSWSVNTMEEMFGNQLHILVVTDARNVTDDFVRQVSNYKRYTSGLILLSPVVVDEFPSIRAADCETIPGLLRALCLLLERNRSGNLSLKDIATLLFATGGEVKVLQTTYNNSSDIDNLRERLTAALEGPDAHFKSCIVQVAMPEENESPAERIQTEVWNIGACVRNKVPDMGCYFCYSDNMPGDSQIRLSVFMH